MKSILSHRNPYIQALSIALLAIIFVACASPPLTATPQPAATSAPSSGEAVTATPEPTRPDDIAAVNPPMSEIASLIDLPPGFEIEIFADEVPSARQLAIGDDGWVFVGTLEKKVFALRDSNNDGSVDERRLIADNLFVPSGVAVHEGALYIAEVDRVRRIPNINQVLESGSAVELEPIISGLPRSTHHGFRYIKFSPEGLLFISLGVPCNICSPSNPELMGVIRHYTPDGGEGKVFARGVRNSVGFDWQPQNGELWFTDNGRDWLGDELPNDELNRAPLSGMHFGYPYCHQGNLPDPEFGDEKTCEEFAAPALLTGPHVANLGMTFYRGDSFSPNYRDGAFIALHGSWNRSEKIGYGVYFARIRDTEVVEYIPFATGWLNGEKVLGRPVDVAVNSDGTLLISDDFRDVIYRVTYSE